MHPLALGRLEVDLGNAGTRGRNLELVAELAGAHEHDAVGQKQRLLNVVRDEDRGFLPPRYPKVLHKHLQLATCLDVECTEGLVEEQHLCVHRQSAGDGDALAHAAGELVGIKVGSFSHGHLCEVLVGDVGHLAFRQAARKLNGRLLDAELDVLLYRHPREERIVLEHN